jgi:hypothetical protein
MACYEKALRNEDGHGQTKRDVPARIDVAGEPAGEIVFEMFVTLN